jgi:hypothetical protein
MTDIFQNFVGNLSREYGYFYQEVDDTVEVFKSAESIKAGAQKIGEYKDTKTSSKWVKASKALMKLELTA